MTKKKIQLAVVIIFCLCGVAAGIMATVSGIKKSKEEKTVRIAFYGVSEEYRNILKSFIPDEDKVEVKIDILSDGAIELSTIKDKYDMLFTWKGEVSELLEASSTDIPSKIIETMPASLQNKKYAPILLDNCELIYNREVLNKAGQDIPSSFSGFLNYLNTSKKYVFSPFFCNGADDRILTAYIGSIIEALGGVSSYNALIKELKNDTDFETLLDISLSSAGLTLRSILNPLKDWPNQGYSHPTWYSAQSSDVLYFAEEGHASVIFTFLSNHREIPYNIINKYDSFVIPPSSSSIEFGIISPVLIGMLLSDNNNAKRYLAEFFTEAAQEELSKQTKLAPVHSRAQPYDRQADDVRYWAASCAAGALPDLYLAAFQRNPKKMKEFAEKIRGYLK